VYTAQRMTIEPSDDHFAQHLLHTCAVSSEQLEAAEAEQAMLSASGETMPLSRVLVKQGVLTQEQVEHVADSMPAGQQQSIGHFKLIRKLGEGGMGAVYLADDTLVGRQVAIKVLPKRYAGSADFLSRFRREAKSAGQLNHPNIVAAYSTGEDRGIHYYVMEYCDGDPLDTLLKRAKRLPWDKAIDYTLQVARGLKHAHDKHIVHRDIKPGNIFITSAGVAKILDMGLSKNIRDSEQSFNTVSGTALGTPHYISPEQAKGEREFDGRSDIYSLGATLYHLVTGETPFQGATPAMVMLKHLNDQLPNPQDVNEEIPDPIVQVIRKMMAKEPSDRYGNCAQVISDLELAAAGKMPEHADVDAEKTSIGMRALRNRKTIASRNPGAKINANTVATIKETSRALVIAGGAAAVMIIAIVGYSLYGMKRHERPGTVIATTPETVPAQTALIEAVAETKPITNPDENTLLFQEDFKKLDLNKLRPGIVALSREKLSIEKLPERDSVLKISTGPTDKGLEAGLKISLDVKKIRGRTILATVQVACPKGFVPFHDAPNHRPALLSAVFEKGGKRSDHVMYLQRDEKEWKQLVRLVKVPDDAQSLQFFIKTTDLQGDVFVDDFRVEVVAEDKPSTVAASTPVVKSFPVIAPPIDDPAHREKGPTKKRFTFPDDPRIRTDLATVSSDIRPYQNEFTLFDLSGICNADVITTATHEAVDSFKADSVSSWTTTSWLRAKEKKEQKDAGIPDDGLLRIPKSTPPGVFSLTMPPAKNAVMLTPAKGRFPKPAVLQLPANQREKYSDIVVLHGGSWGDGRVRVALHYSSGKDDVAWLKIEDWHPQFRLPLAPRETVAVATLTTHDKPAEMCAQVISADSARMLESLTFSFDPINALAAEEVPHDDRFSAGIFAVSALPAAKPNAGKITK